MSGEETMVMELSHGDGNVDERRREELSSAKATWRGLMVHVRLGESGKHITTPPPRFMNTQTKTY